VFSATRDGEPATRTSECAERPRGCRRDVRELRRKKKRGWPRRPLIRDSGRRRRHIIDIVIHDHREWSWKDSHADQNADPVSECRDLLSMLGLRSADVRGVFHPPRVLHASSPSPTLGRSLMNDEIDHPRVRSTICCIVATWTFIFRAKLVFQSPVLSKGRKGGIYVYTIAAKRKKHFMPLFYFFL